MYKKLVWTFDEEENAWVAETPFGACWVEQEPFGKWAWYGDYTNDCWYCDSLAEAQTAAEEDYHWRLYEALSEDGKGAAGRLAAEQFAKETAANY